MERGKTWTGRSLAAATVVIAACACTPEAPFEGVLNVDASAPTFLSCAATKADRVEFLFSEPVVVSSLRFDRSRHDAVATDDSAVVATFSQALEEGGEYVADIIVEDSEGNTLSVLVPFRGRNDRMPPLRITELRTEYAKPKVEFVELHLEAAGQLGGMRLVSSDQGFDVPLFEFPATEAAAGEYVVVHLRTLEDGCVDETGARDASSGTDASPTGRDFWLPGAEKRVRKIDAIAVLDMEGRILDALLISETKEGDWKNDELVAAAERLEDGGAWKRADGGSGPLSPADAFMSEATTTTRTICRSEADADTDSASDWYVTVTKGATPGRENNPSRYIPKDSAGN